MRSASARRQQNWVVRTYITSVSWSKWIL